MRRNGKTTRLVDKAIQTLFTEKKIIIPRATDERSLRALDEKFIIIDLEKTVEMQDYLYTRILNRLNLEHTYQYVHDPKSRTITLKQ